MTSEIPIEQLRPLVDGLVIAEGETLLLRPDERELVVRGNAAFVRKVLERCDGRRTSLEIAAELDADAGEVCRLLGELRKKNVVVDCTQAWRAFHRRSSARSGLYRTPGREELTEFRRTRFAPPHRQTLRRLESEQGSLAELAAHRHSAQPGGGQRRVDFAELSTVVEAMYGERADGSRPVPSGGGAYPLALHVLCRSRMPRLEPGLWWYEPSSGLRLVRSEGIEIDRLFASEPLTDELISYQHPILFVSAEFARPSRKYSNRAYRLALMETGAVMQNAYLAGSELELPVRAFAGIIEEEVDRFLELPADAHAVLAVLIGS